MTRLLYEIQVNIDDDWKILNQYHYTSKKVAELALYDHWRELDLQQIDYKMDNYLICEVK